MVNLVEFEQLRNLQRMEHVGEKTFDFLLAVLSDSEMVHCLACAKFYGFMNFSAEDSTLELGSGEYGRTSGRTRSKASCLAS